MMIASIFLQAAISLLTAAPADPAFFAEKVAPVLERRCVQCHNDATRKGGLSLQSEKSLTLGGDSGEAIKPGNVAASPLLDQVSGEKPEMPKKGPPLTAQEIESLRQW